MQTEIFLLTVDGIISLYKNKHKREPVVIRRVLISSNDMIILIRFWLSS